MLYMYHGVPEPMIGSQLIPLNQMPESMAAVRSFHERKYQGREEIRARRIPLLNCLWNDVVQFLPIDPQTIFEKQVELGIISAIPSYRFYKIDVQQLDPDKTVVYFKDAVGEDHVRVAWLKDVNFAELQAVPKATISYYQSLTGTNELPFNYQFVPHILFAGSVDVSSAEIVTLH